MLAISTKNVTINSTISSEQPVCPGNQVNFTCETRGSDIIAWTSIEYISPLTGGTRIEFSAFDVGVIRRIDKNTVATLVSAADDIKNVSSLISLLIIKVSPLYRNPSITCLHVGRLINATVSFVVPGKLSTLDHIPSDYSYNGYQYSAFSLRTSMLMPQSQMESETDSRPL